MATVTTTIDINTGDGYQILTGAWNGSGDGNNTNYAGDSVNHFVSGLIFRNVQIPINSLITSAYIEVYGYQTTPGGNTVSLLVKGIAEDSATLFDAGGSNKPSTRTYGSNTTVWTNTYPFAFGLRDSPDISNIIQEIVSRPGWAIGNNLGLALFDNGTGGTWSLAFYDYAKSSNPAKLVVTYTQLDGAKGPRNLKVKDVTPLNTMKNFPQSRMFTSTVAAGQPMGLLLAITYPVAGTFSTPRGG